MLSIPGLVVTVNLVRPIGPSWQRLIGGHRHGDTVARVLALDVLVCRVELSCGQAVAADDVIEDLCVCFGLQEDSSDRLSTQHYIHILLDCFISLLIVSSDQQPLAMGSKIAQSTWELNNSISTIDEVYNYDNEGQRAILRERPWKKDPHHFKHVRISAVALVKMVTHARSGGAYEIMGLMQGKIEGDTFIVMDAFALPVTGTETRVNAGSEGEEYMVQYQTMCQEVRAPTIESGDSFRMTRL